MYVCCTHTHCSCMYRCTCKPPHFIWQWIYTLVPVRKGITLGHMVKKWAWSYVHTVYTLIQATAYPHCYKKEHCKHTLAHSSIGGSVGTSMSSVVGSWRSSGIRTSPKLILKGTHQTRNQSMVKRVISSGRVRMMVRSTYARSKGSELRAWRPLKLNKYWSIL